MRITKIIVLVIGLFVAMPITSHAGGWHRHHHHHGFRFFVYPSCCASYYYNAPLIIQPPIIVQPPLIISPPQVVLPQQVLPQPSYVPGYMGDPRYAPAAPQVQPQVIPQQSQTQILPPSPPLTRVPIRDRSKISVIEKFITGEAACPDDLPQGGIVKMCNAHSGEYSLESGHGKYYHQQQCWICENPVGGNYLRTPAPPVK